MERTQEMPNSFGFYEVHIASTTLRTCSDEHRIIVPNSVLDDNFKGTTEQFVLHFNEQFRQLEEKVKLTLLQTAVRSINDLRIVETLDECSYGHGSSTSLSYHTYYDLLINACVGMTKPKKPI